MKKKEKELKICYKPAPELVSIMQKLSRFKIMEREVHNKILAGDKLTEEEVLYTQLEKKARLAKTLNTSKSRMLDKYVFPSMANLIIFFRYANMPELREKFSKDIQSLLFAEPNRSSDSKTISKPDYSGIETMFYRLITNMLALDKQSKEINDFRFILFAILQKEIWEMVRNMGNSKYETDLFNNVIVPDISRAVAWVSSLSREAQAHGAVKFDRNKRPVLF